MGQVGESLNSCDFISNRQAWRKLAKCAAKKCLDRGFRDSFCCVCVLWVCWDCDDPTLIEMALTHDRVDWLKILCSAEMLLGILSGGQMW